MPTIEELEKLNTIARDTGLTYTVHLPLDLYLGDPDQRLRTKSVERARHVIESTGALNPFAYIIHFEKRRPDGSEIANTPEWCEVLRESARQLREFLPQPALLSVEYLRYPLELIEDIVAEFGFSYVLDVGHMLLFQRDYEHYLQKYLAQTRVIHLHGVKGGKDHLSLAEGEGKDLEQVFSILKGADYDGVLTLEVFSRNDYQTSMEVVRQLWPANTN